MRMNPKDIADVTGATYTYLLNGTAPNGNWTGLFKPGERVRLRFINGSSQSYFDVRIPGLKMTVVAADGQNVQPISVDEFRIAVAETFDVIVEPTGQDAFTIFAQSMDRSGYARGTLATREGLSAPVPEPDPRPLLTTADMGHGERGIGAGLSSAEAGLRLRYEFRREFAPYVGVTWNRKFFGTADLAEAAGEDTSGARLALGVRVWF